MKEKKKSLCHDCLNPFESTQLWITPINVGGKTGPEHSIGLCKDCVKERGRSTKVLETMKEFNKRMSKYLGLKV